MKHIIKLVIQYIFYGISMGCTFFVVMCLSYAIWGKEDFLMQIFEDFTRQSIGAMIIGIACGGTSVIYQFERPSCLLKVIIHFCIGMGVFYFVGIYLGWIPFYPDKIILTVLQFLFSCGIFMIIWLCFYRFNRNDAKKINQRLIELERDNISNKR